MKSYGKVTEYDGYTGTIVGIDGKNYLLLDVELVDKDIKIDDYVSFDADVYEDVEFTRYVARFIKRIKKDDIKS